VKIDGNQLQYASIELKTDRDIVFEAVKNNGYAFFHASYVRASCDDFEILLEAIKTFPRAINFASHHLLRDRHFMLQAVKTNPYVFRHWYRDIHFETCSGPGCCFYIASNREIALLALKKHAYFYSYLSAELSHDFEFGLEAVKSNGDVICHVPMSFRNDIVVTLVEWAKR
jgi:hypothetical protein